MEIQETKSRVTKTVTATSQGYNLTATANIEDGKIVNMSGYVVSDTMGVDNIRFDSYRQDDELKTNYYGIAADDRQVCDIFDELIDAVVAAYETK